MIFTAICGSIFSLLADMPRDYYPNSLEGKNGAELKTELHNLLKNHTRLPYGSYDYNRIAVGGEMPPITTEPTLSPDLNTTVPTIYTT